MKTQHRVRKVWHSDANMNTSMEKPVTETANKTIGTKLCHHNFHSSNVGHLQKVFSNVRKKSSRPQGDEVLDFEVNAVIWESLMLATMKGALHLGQYYQENLRTSDDRLRDLPEWLEGFTDNLEDTKMPALAHFSQDSDSERPSKVALRKHSIYTHIPKDRNGEVCLRTKNTRALCRKRTGEAVPRAIKFGQNNVGHFAEIDLQSDDEMFGISTVEWNTIPWMRTTFAT